MLTSACPDRGTYLAKWCLEGHIQSDLWCWCCKSGPTAPWFRSRSFSTQVQCAWLPVAWALWSAGCCTAHTQHDTGPFTTSPPDTSTAILCSGLLCIVLSAACRVKESAVPGEVSAHTGWNQNQPHQYTNQHPHQVLGLKVPPLPPLHAHTHKVQAISFTCKMTTTTSSAEKSVLSCWDSIQGTTDWTTTWPPKWGWSFHPSVPVAYKTTQCNTSCRHVPDQTLFLQNHIAEHIQQTCPRSNSVPTEPDSVTHPADKSQIKVCSYRTRQCNTCRHVPATTCWGLTGLWRPPMQNKLPGPQQKLERSACFSKQTWGSDQRRQEEDRDF